MRIGELNTDMEVEPGQTIRLSEDGTAFEAVPVQTTEEAQINAMALAIALG